MGNTLTTGFYDVGKANHIYPEGVELQSPGSRSAPWETIDPQRRTPQGFHMTARRGTRHSASPTLTGLPELGHFLFPGCGCATLGFGVEPLRGNVIGGVCVAATTYYAETTICLAGSPAP